MIMYSMNVITNVKSNVNVFYFHKLPFLNILQVFDFI